MIKDKIKRIASKRPSLRRKEPEKSLEQAIQNLPRITNETVAEHREEVLSSARKYIYPIAHSPHRIIIISTALIAFLILSFFTYCVVALYKFHATDTFIYRVTQVIPFPIARADGRFVSYEDYLFELRHQVHYYQTQQRVDFTQQDNEAQMEELRDKALTKVINHAYIKQLAKENNIVVTNQEVDTIIAVLRDQNRLGSNDQVFADVLKEYWDWSVADFKRELRMQILTQKVITGVLDTDIQQRAKDAYARVAGGEDFATVAQQLSDDKNSALVGGQYGLEIDESTRDLSPQVIDALFKLQPGQISEVINTGSTLEILKVNEVNGTKLRASHIVFSFKEIDEYLAPIREKEKPRAFINP